jgi:hypothetical protein
MKRVTIFVLIILFAVTPLLAVQTEGSSVLWLNGELPPFTMVSADEKGFTIRSNVNNFSYEVLEEGIFKILVVITA